ncbi:MAG TPA: hypothetical protein VGM63_14040 [Mucilaginibacter sp.]|jgi:hypothetical protein
MVKTIYIKLLDEGVDVYRPVPAVEIEDNTFEIMGHDIYDPENEVWEFSPGTFVAVEKHNLNKEMALVAVKLK